MLFPFETAMETSGVEDYLCIACNIRYVIRHPIAERAISHRIRNANFMLQPPDASTLGNRCQYNPKDFSAERQNYLVTLIVTKWAINGDKHLHNVKGAKLSLSHGPGGAVPWPNPGWLT